MGAMSHGGEQRYRTPLYSANLLLALACFFTFGCYVMSYMRIPIVPLYVKMLGATAKMVGIINSMFFFTAGLLSFPLGFLSDRFGRKHVASAGLALLALTSFGLYITHTPLEVLVLYFFFGVGLAAYGPPMMSFVADIAPSSHLGRSYGWYTTSLYIGMSIGPALGSWIADHAGFHAVFVSSGTLTVVLVIGMLLFLPNIRKKSPAPRASQVPSKRSALKNRMLIGCWLITFGGCFALGMFVTFIPLHARDAGIAISKIGLIFFVQGMSNALSRIPFGWLSDKVASRTTLVVVGILMAVCAMLGFAASHSLLHFVVSALVLGSGMAMAFTSIGALVAEAVPASMRGFAMGGYNASIYFGIMVSSMTMGAVIERWGYVYAFLYASAVVACLLVAFIAMVHDRL